MEGWGTYFASNDIYRLVLWYNIPGYESFYVTYIFPKGICFQLLRSYWLSTFKTRQFNYKTKQNFLNRPVAIYSLNLLRKVSDRLIREVIMESQYVCSKRFFVCLFLEYILWNCKHLITSDEQNQQFHTVQDNTIQVSWHSINLFKLFFLRIRPSTKDFLMRGPWYTTTLTKQDKTKAYHTNKQKQKSSH